MQRQHWSPKGIATRALAIVFIISLVIGAATGPAVAEPRLFVSGGSLEAKTAVVGEDFNVTFRVSNTGSSGGALNVDIKRNGSVFATERVVVDADSDKTFTKTVQFDESGRFVIKADSRKLGTVRVSAARATVTAQDTDNRTVEVYGGSVPTTEPYSIDFPPATNRSFAIERWTVETRQAQFTQEVTEYTTPSAAPMTVPSGERETVIGVLTVGSTDGVDTSTMRVAINRSTLQSAGLDVQTVSAYTQNGSVWDPVETTVVEERPDRVVYEATVAGSSTVAIGHLQPTFTIEDTSLRTVGTGAGQRIIFEGVVSNSGSISGAYDAQLLVNDETVNETSATISAGEERTITLSHEVTAAGTYEIGLNDRDVGSVVISEGQVTTDTSTETPISGTTGPGDGNQGGDGGGSQDGDGDGGAVPDGMPDTIFGINTLYLVGGIAVAIVLFFGIAAVLRGRGGDGGFNQL